MFMSTVCAHDRITSQPVYNYNPPHKKRNCMETYINIFINFTRCEEFKVPFQVKARRTL